MKNLASCCLSVIAALVFATCLQAQIPELINYQGRLLDGTNLVSGSRVFVFRFFSVDSGGSSLYAEEQVIPVVDGVYSVRIGASNAVPGALAALFTNQTLYLEVTVAGTTLQPRERVAAVGYAIRSGGVGSGAITTAMLADDAVTGAKIADGSISNADMAAEAMTGAQIANGTIGTDDLNGTVLTNTFWRLSGNSGTTPGTHYVGTADGSALELRVNGQRVVRYEAGTRIMAGDSASSVASDGGTVAGGFGNRVDGQGGTIGGGRYNSVSNWDAVVGGGVQNQASGLGATVGGGERNRATGSRATISGGADHRVDGHYGTVAGGMTNRAGGNFAAVGGGASNAALGVGSVVAGGLSNVASGIASAVPGGTRNVAAGDYALAAGYRARASHSGSFVWSDNQGGDFGSSSSNQFLIRAGGGVAIGTTNTLGTLRVVGSTSSALVVVGPNAAQNGLSELILAEDRDNDYYMSLRYDGDANRLGVYGKVLATEYGPHLVIDRLGPIGIGTTNISSTYALSVGGKIRCEEVVVESGWADFVFGEGYRLAPLDEVEQMVLQQKHLPGVPSAAEVAAQGAALGSLQAVLLQKIEELTLHTIRQQKEIDALKRDLEALRGSAERE